MLQRDYIMRMIEQLSQVVSKILFAKQAKNFDEALHISQNAYDELFGLSGEMAHKLDAATLAQLLNDKEKIKAFSALMHEEGNLLVEKGNPEEARACFLKSLSLYQKVLAMQGNQDADCQKAIEILESRL